MYEMSRTILKFQCHINHVWISVDRPSIALDIIGPVLP